MLFHHLHVYVVDSDAKIDVIVEASSDPISLTSRKMPSTSSVYRSLMIIVLKEGM